MLMQGQLRSATYVRCFTSVRQVQRMIPHRHLRTQMASVLCRPGFESVGDSFGPEDVVLGAEEVADVFEAPADVDTQELAALLRPGLTAW